MKIYQLLKLLLSLFCLVTMSFSSNQFSNSLWTLDLIGGPEDINFLNDNELLTATNKGLVAKLNLNNGSTIWKRLYNSPMVIASDGDCK